MKRSGKILFLVFSVFVSVLFTSCLDSMQSVSLKNGQYVINARFTLAKSTLQLLSSLDDMENSDYESDDIDDYLSQLGNSLGNYKNNNASEFVYDFINELRGSDMFPDGGLKTDINTDYDVGISYSAKINKNSYAIDNFREYIPVKNEKFAYLNVPSYLSDEYSELGEILVGSKAQDFYK